MYALLYSLLVPWAKQITDYQLNIKQCIYLHKQLAIANVAAYGCVLLFICLVDNILLISNRVTEMINENKLNIYAYMEALGKIPPLPRA